MLTLERLEIVQDDFCLTANLSVPTGARVAVIGPSGAGKSTLLAAIAGFLKPGSGKILWDGVDLADLPPGERPLSLLFQDNNLFPHLNAAENVGLALRSDLKLSSSQKDAVTHVLERVGLKGFGNRKPAALSGGQIARVALARMILRQKPLVLLDEPFGALGPALKGEMLTLLADLLDETGATLLMVSHDPDDAVRISNQTILVAEGIAHPPTDTATLFANPPDALKNYLG